MLGTQRSKVGQTLQVQDQESLYNVSTILAPNDGLEYTRIGNEEETLNSPTGAEEESLSPGGEITNLSRRISDMNSEHNDFGAHAQITKFNVRTGHPLTPTQFRAEAYLKSISENRNKESGKNIILMSKNYYFFNEDIKKKGNRIERWVFTDILLLLNIFILLITIYFYFIYRKPRSQKPIEKITLDEPIFIDLTQNEMFSFDDPTKISQLGEGDDTSLVPTVEDGLRAELSRKSRSEIGLQEKNWPVLEEFVNPIYESIRRHQEMLQESQVQVTDLSEVPLPEGGVTDISVHPVPEEVRVTDISVHPVPEEVRANELVPREEGTAGSENLTKRRSSYTQNFIENPRMTNEEYRRFITRRKKAADKAYANVEELMRNKFKHLEEKEEELNSEDELYHWDSGIPEVKVPAPAYEMGMVFRIPTSADLANKNYIPKFELLQRSPGRDSAVVPPPEQELLYLDSLRDSVFGMAGLRISGVVPPEAGDIDMQVEGGDLLPAPRIPIGPTTSLLHQLPSPSSIVPQVEEGDLLPAPLVPIGPRTSLLQQLPSPSSIVPQVEETSERSAGREPPRISGLQSVPSPLLRLPRVQATNGFPSLPLQRSPLYLSQDFVMEKLAELCRPEADFAINFLSLCALSESRLVAARIFQLLINLCGQKKVLLTQTGSHPSEILIKLNHNWSFLI